MVKCVQISKSYELRIITQLIYVIRMSCFNVCNFLALIHNVPIKLLVYYTTLKSYMFRLYEAIILGIHASEICKKKKGNHTAVVVHSTVETQGQRQSLT
jgi:hypothetical protein